VGKTQDTLDISFRQTHDRKIWKRLHGLRSGLSGETGTRAIARVLEG
jgi:hypothetical protein